MKNPFHLSELIYLLGVLANELEKKGYTEKELQADLYAYEVSEVLKVAGDASVRILGPDHLNKMLNFAVSCRGLPEPDVN